MQVLKYNVWHPYLCIYIHRNATFEFSIIMHMPRIASMIKIVFQICCDNYVLCGNTADIDFEEDNSHLGESEGAEENSMKGTGVLSILIIYNLRTL